MKSDRLQDAIGNIDDDFIMDAHNDFIMDVNNTEKITSIDSRKKKVIIPATTIAACLCLLIGGGVFYATRGAGAASKGDSMNEMTMMVADSSMEADDTPEESADEFADFQEAGQITMTTGAAKPVFSYKEGESLDSYNDELKDALGTEDILIIDKEVEDLADPLDSTDMSNGDPSGKIVSIIVPSKVENQGEAVLAAVIYQVVTEDGTEYECYVEYIDWQQYTELISIDE